MLQTLLSRYGVESPTSSLLCATLGVLYLSVVLGFLGGLASFLTQLSYSDSAPTVFPIFLFAHLWIMLFPCRVVASASSRILLHSFLGSRIFDCHWSLP